MADDTELEAEVAELERRICGTAAPGPDASRDAEVHARFEARMAPLRATEPLTPAERRVQDTIDRAVFSAPLGPPPATRDPYDPALAAIVAEIHRRYAAIEAVIYGEPDAEAVTAAPDAQAPALVPEGGARREAAGAPVNVGPAGSGAPIVPAISIFAWDRAP